MGELGDVQRRQVSTRGGGSIALKVSGRKEVSRGGGGGGEHDEDEPEMLQDPFNCCFAGQPGIATIKSFLLSYDFRE